MASVRPNPPPTRKFTQVRSKRSYERLLDAAATVFSEIGYRSVGVADIAERAELSVGAFYRYFPDKRGIFIELAHLYLDRQHAVQAEYLESWRRRILAGEGTGRMFLEEAIPGAFRQQAINPDVLNAFIALSYEDKAVGSLRRGYDESDRANLARFFSAVTDRERIPSPLSAARLFDMTVEEAVRWAWLHGGAAAQNVCGEVVEMFDCYLFGGERAGELD